MDSVFGIGAPELIFILILAGIVMGPHRIRHVALWLGKTTAQLQAISRSFVRQLNAELDAVDGGGDLRDTMNEVKELRRQVRELRREITSGMVSPIKEGQQLLQETQQLAKQTIAPPAIRDNSGEQAEANGNDDSLSVTESQTTVASDLPKVVDVADDPEA